MKAVLQGEEDRLLKTGEVSKLTGFTRVSINKMVEEKEFPEPDFVSKSGYKHWWKSTIYAYFNRKHALAS